MVDWGAVGAIAGLLALVEAPAIIAVAAGYRWVKDVNRRLQRIEDRSHQRRWDDPPTGG